MQAALLLAGGASSRMGRDKATMMVDEVAMVTRVAHALREAGCRPILISVHDGDQRRRIGGLLAHMGDVDYLVDEGLERGARPALLGALRACHARGVERVQLAPCDAPWITAEVFKRLHEGDRRVMMPRGERLQPLLANIEVEAVLAALEKAPSRRSLSDLMRGVPHRIVDMTDLDPQVFHNVNRPEDIDQS